MDPIKIGCAGSPTLRPRTCGRPVVSQPLVASNQYTQSKKFVALQQHTAHLTEKYEQLSANYEQHTAHLTDKYE